LRIYFSFFNFDVPIYSDASGIVGQIPDRGAKRVSTSLNLLFEEIIKIIIVCGGDVDVNICNLLFSALRYLCFTAGDHLTILWRCANDFDVAIKARLALACGVCLVNRLNNYEVFPGLILPLCVGITKGEATSMFLGGVENRWEVSLSSHLFSSFSFIFY
jgi:hypothetical protein